MASQCARPRRVFIRFPLPGSQEMRVFPSEPRDHGQQSDPQSPAFTAAEQASFRPPSPQEALTAEVQAALQFALKKQQI